MKINLKFLSPRLVNILITLVVISLPLLRERVQLPEGGYEIVWHRPIILLVLYPQMNEYYAFFLMVGFSLLIYLVVSAVLVLASKVLKSKRKS